MCTMLQFLQTFKSRFTNLASTPGTIFSSLPSLHRISPFIFSDIHGFETNMVGDPCLKVGGV